MPHAVLDTSDAEDCEAQIRAGLRGDWARGTCSSCSPRAATSPPSGAAARSGSLRRKGRRREAAAGEQMTHVLPPHPTGALAALRGNPEADVVFAAHTGLGLAAFPRELWRETPIGRTLRTRMWLARADRAPAGRRGDDRVALRLVEAHRRLGRARRARRRRWRPSRALSGRPRGGSARPPAGRTRIRLRSWRPVPSRAHAMPTQAKRRGPRAALLVLCTAAIAAAVVVLLGFKTTRPVPPRHPEERRSAHRHQHPGRPADTRWIRRAVDRAADADRLRRQRSAPAEPGVRQPAAPARPRRPPRPADRRQQLRPQPGADPEGQAEPRRALRDPAVLGPDRPGARPGHRRAADARPRPGGERPAAPGGGGASDGGHRRTVHRRVRDRQRAGEVVGRARGT